MFLPWSSRPFPAGLDQDGRLGATPDWWHAATTERRTRWRLRAHLGNHRHGPTRRRRHARQISGCCRGVLGKMVVKRKVVRERSHRNSVDVERPLRAVEEAAGSGGRAWRGRLGRRGPFTGEGAANQPGRQLRQLLLLLRRRTGRSQNSVMKRLRSGLGSNRPPHTGAPKCRSPFGRGTNSIRRQVLVIEASGRRKAVPVALFRRQVRAGEGGTWGPAEEAACLLAVVVIVVSARSTSRCLAPRRTTTTLTHCCSHNTINNYVQWHQHADRPPAYLWPILWPYDTEINVCIEPAMDYITNVKNASSKELGIWRYTATFTPHETKLTWTGLQPLLRQLLRRLWRRLW